MAAKYWIKLYHEVLDDAKMGRMPDRLWRRTIELFLLAGEHDKDGELPSLSDMAWRLRVEPQDLMQEIHSLARMNIVTIEGDDLLVTNFSKRQGASTSAERMKELRKRSKEKSPQSPLKEKEEDTDHIYIHSVPSHVTVTNVTSGNGKRYESSQFEKLLLCLVQEVKTPYGAGVNEGEFETAVYTLIGWDATEDAIRGFRVWWDENGYYKGLPSLKSFLGEYRNYLGGIKTTKPSQNGNHNQDLTIWKRVIDAVSRGKYGELTPEQFAAVKAVDPLVIKSRNDFNEQKIRADFFRALQGA